MAWDNQGLQAVLKKWDGWCFLLFQGDNFWLILILLRGVLIGGYADMFHWWNMLRPVEPWYPMLVTSRVEATMAFYRSRFVGNKKCHKQLQSDWGCFIFSHENGDDLGIMKSALPHKKNHEIWWEFTMSFIKFNQQFWLPTFSIDKNVTMVPIQNMIIGAAKTDHGIPQ